MDTTGTTTGTEAPRAAPSAEAPAAKAAAGGVRAEPRDGFYWGTGRRKASVARVRIREGAGQIQINDRDLSGFFPVPRHQSLLLGPLRRTEMLGKLDVFIRVEGGGPTGQCGAAMMGLARALVAFRPETALSLREDGYLTRDPREVERKKYGQSGARKRFQFSKR